MSLYCLQNGFFFVHHLVEVNVMVGEDGRIDPADNVPEHDMGPSNPHSEHPAEKSMPGLIEKRWVVLLNSLCSHGSIIFQSDRRRSCMLSIGMVGGAPSITSITNCPSSSK